jgi:hypothetical protein
LKPPLAATRTWIWPSGGRISLHFRSCRRSAVRDRAERGGTPGDGWGRAAGCWCWSRPMIGPPVGMGGDRRGNAGAVCKIAGLRLPRFESWSCHCGANRQTRWRACRRRHERVGPRSLALVPWVARNRLVGRRSVLAGPALDAAGLRPQRVRRRQGPLEVPAGSDGGGGTTSSRLMAGSGTHRRGPPRGCHPELADEVGSNVAVLFERWSRWWEDLGVVEHDDRAGVR